MSEPIWGLRTLSASPAGSAVGFRGCPCCPCSPSPGAARVLLLQGLGSLSPGASQASPPQSSVLAWLCFGGSSPHFKQQTCNKPLLPAALVPTLLPSLQPAPGVPLVSAPHTARFAPRASPSSSSHAVPATSLFIWICIGGKLRSMVKKQMQQ